MKVKLNSTQYNFLKDHLSNERSEFFELFSANDNSEIEIDEDTASAIRDWAGEKLQKEGFDINYEPNNMGKTLEEIIDLFYA